jgi:hypothetical protein
MHRKRLSPAIGCVEQQPLMIFRKNPPKLMLRHSRNITIGAIALIANNRAERADHQRRLSFQMPLTPSGISITPS